jgi:hypothetical protein
VRASENAVGSSTIVVSDRAGSTGVGYTASSTYTPGHGSFGEWASYQAAIQTAAAAPVQDEYTGGSVSATLGATPTVGNMLVLFMYASTFGGSVTPPAGFSEIFHYTDVPSDAEMALAVRCVESGDSATTTWANGGGGSALACATYLAEWEIT